MRLVPEVVLLRAETVSVLRPVLDQETERIEARAAQDPVLGALMVENGWTARAVAWGQIVGGLIDLADLPTEEAENAS